MASKKLKEHSLRLPLDRILIVEFLISTLNFQQRAMLLQF